MHEDEDRLYEDAVYAARRDLATLVKQALWWLAVGLSVTALAVLMFIDR